MKQLKRGLAMLMALLLVMPAMPVAAEETTPTDQAVAEEVLFNTGSHTYRVVEQNNLDDDMVSGSDAGEAESSQGIGDDYFAENGSYTINIPEEDPFFPYEVQFTCNGEITREWFMTPDDSVEIGGHTFYVSAYFSNKIVTQMSLNVAGDTVIVYPQEKEFTEDEGIAPMSLLPLEEVYLNVDLSAYTPAELTMVSVASIFTGSQVQATDKVMWTYSGDDDYTISESGDFLDLSRFTYYGGTTTWQMIVGDDDQLAADNIRYLVSVKNSDSENWLTPVVYKQDSAGTRSEITVTESEYRDYSNEREYSVYVFSDEMGTTRQVYLGLAVNPDIFANTVYDHIKAFEGRYTTPETAASGKDITAQLFAADMTAANAGYLVSKSTDTDITFVTYDASGNATGCLPFQLYLSSQGNSISYSFFGRTSSGDRYYPSDTISSRYVDGYIHRTYTLYKEYAADSDYILNLTYKNVIPGSTLEVTGAYVGQYSSIAEATAAGAADIKDVLFSNDYRTGGYSADYSQGVYFTIFVGADGTADQEIYQYCIKTEEGENSGHSLSSGTSVQFYGLVDSNGSISSDLYYKVNYDEDSYGEFNYCTILVDDSVDLTHLAPTFYTVEGVHLYTGGGSTQEESGKSFHDFSQGPVQYTAAAENGEDSKNYWLQIVKATSGEGWLYMNSLMDSNANTTVENGVTYSIREVMIDSYHNNQHDILLANMGTDAISNMAVELSSDSVELDDYWTLSGNYDLAGFSTARTSTFYGELSNLAKIRLKAKEGMTSGEVNGTLTIKSGNAVLMVLTLTGSIGDPCITTEEIPQAVKYVPYGSMIQNDNKYSWNKITYMFMSGTLPTGMEVKANGEIYGVPTETGDFTFTVRMRNSGYFKDDTKTYTLTVVENTDANVDAATDAGYDVTQRIDPAQGSMTMVSQGIYNEFVDVYLDGVKLAAGTDYSSESGSTRITIFTQTLVDKQSGTHTLGVEFRTQSTGDLKRAAQNFTIGDGIFDDDDSDDDSNNDGNAATASVVPVKATTAKETVYYTVVAGDTLWKIAEKYYGDGNYWKIIFANNAATIKDPNKIFAGQKLILEAGHHGNMTAQIAESTGYTVKPGDTLWKIAQKVYGNGKKWKKIYEANSNVILDPEKIYVGQVLMIPES